MNRTVIFYAPVGNGIEKARIGGAEKGALRVIELLENNGFNVIQVDKPYIESGKVVYLTRILRTINHIKKLIKQYPDALVYIVGFYEKNATFEEYLVSYAKKQGNKVIYEPKNGRFVKIYEQESKSYKNKINSIIYQSDTLFCQGTTYVDFIDKKIKNKTVYVPNYVLDRLRIPINRNRPNDIIKIIYFGRVTPTKGIDIALKTVAQLAEKNISSSLTIMGGFENSYKKYLDDLIHQLGLEGSVIFTGPKKFEEIREKLQQSHYFIFPSNEPDEGHSNALTEAMLFGVVPIASDVGFNRDIISDNSLVINSKDSLNYANCIENIEKQNLWEIKSLQVIDRVEKNYSERIVKSNVLGAINKLAGMQDD